MYDKIRSKMKTGDIISFSGKGRTSNIIKWSTKSDISHVGIVFDTQLGKTPRVLLMESTNMNNIADAKTGEFIKGVKLQQLSSRINSNEGQVYWQKLNVSIGADAEDKMLNWLLSAHAKKVPYDTIQAIGAGVDLLDWMPGIENEPDFSSLFCSELVCKALQLADVVCQSLNPSEQTPADVVSYGCLDERVQIG